MSVLRIYSYLPNPRIWKATIAARIAGLEVEVRGAAPEELMGWLWDFDARPLTDADRANTSIARQAKVGFSSTVYKTDAFLELHPFGTVPAAFSPDGAVGVFESNSIMRAVGRLAKPELGLYGTDAYTAARVDSFLDAALVFARDGQLYLFALRDANLDAALHGRVAESFAAFMGGIDRALSGRHAYIAGDQVTLADIAFAAELCLFSNERLRHRVLGEKGLPPILGSNLAQDYPSAMAHFERLRRHPDFAPDMEPYLAKIEAGEAKRAAGAAEAKPAEPPPVGSGGKLLGRLRDLMGNDG